MVTEVRPMQACDETLVLMIAAPAGSDGGQNPVDVANRAAAASKAAPNPAKLIRFVRFDPAKKMRAEFVRPTISRLLLGGANLQSYGGARREAHNQSAETPTELLLATSAKAVWRRRARAEYAKRTGTYLLTRTTRDDTISQGARPQLGSGCSTSHEGCKTLEGRFSVEAKDGEQPRAHLATLVRFDDAVPAYEGHACKAVFTTRRSCWRLTPLAACTDMP